MTEGLPIQRGAGLDPVRGLLPKFTLPASQRLDPPDPHSPVDNPQPDPTPPPAEDRDRSGPAGPRPDPTATPTGTSATAEDKPTATPKEAGELLAALLIALGVGIGAVVRWRSRGGYRLRQPTRAQAGDVGAPLGRIAARHVPLGALTPDLRDLVLAAVGVNSYLDDGRLLLPAGPDPGVPDDLNQEPS